VAQARDSTVPTNKREIDRLILRERTKHLAWWIVGGGSVAVILTIIFLASLPGETREISGIVLGVIGMPAEDGHHLYLRVQLETGREIRARIPNSTPVGIGKRVVVSETNSRFAAGRRYRFLRSEAP
jgi:hypothetical protein